jgi:hypothetical protein
MKPMARKVQDIRIWMLFSKKRDVPDEMLIYTQMAKLAYDIYAI